MGENEENENNGPSVTLEVGTSERLRVSGIDSLVVDSIEGREDGTIDSDIEDIDGKLVDGLLDGLLDGSLDSLVIRSIEGRKDGLIDGVSDG